MIYRRPDSPFWWLYLERPRGQGAIREPTKIPVVGVTEDQTKAFRAAADAAYYARMLALAQCDHGLAPPAPKPARTWRAHAAWYSATISPTKRNVGREQSMLRQLTAALGDTPLTALTRPRLLEWRQTRLTQVSARTVNREAQVLHHCLSYAVPTYLDANPAAKLGHVHEEDVEVRVLTGEEEDRLLGVLALEERALILCALDTLLRLTTAATLPVSRDKGAYLEALNTKTRAYKVPVSPRLRAALDAVPGRGPWCFPRYALNGRRDADADRRNRVIGMFAAACKRADVPYGRAVGGVTFHALRHTGASRMLAGGVSIKTVMQIGGWQTLRVLERYLHPTDAERRRAVAIIGDPSRYTVRSDDDPP